MKNNELFIGLDIGTTKIVAMIGHVNEYSKLKIIGLGRSESLGVHRGVVNNITILRGKTQTKLLKIKILMM